MTCLYLLCWYLVWEIVLRQEVGPLAMLLLPPGPQLCPECQCRQSQVQGHVTPVQAVGDVLPQLEVEQVPGCWRGQLLQGDGEQQEAVVQGEAGLAAGLLLHHQPGQPRLWSQVQPLSTAVHHQPQPDGLPGWQTQVLGSHLLQVLDGGRGGLEAYLGQGEGRR